MHSENTNPSIQEEKEFESISRTQARQTDVTAEQEVTDKENKVRKDDKFPEDEDKPPSPPIRNYKPMVQGVGERAIRHVLRTCYFDRPAIDYLLRNARIHSVRKLRSIAVEDWKGLCTQARRCEDAQGHGRLPGG